MTGPGGGGGPVEDDRPLWTKLAWFAALWLAGVAGVSALAYFLRFAMGL